MDFHFDELVNLGEGMKFLPPEVLLLCSPISEVSNDIGFMFILQLVLEISTCCFRKQSFFRPNFFIFDLNRSPQAWLKHP